MILLAVGTQLPFNRLVRLVDDWARSTGRTDVVAQIGETSYRPHTIRAFSFLPPDVFQSLQAEASLHIGHAGMGSILQAMEHAKPIVIMPREFSRNEHRNDHQMATARRFADVDGVHVAMDDEALRAFLDNIDGLKAGKPLSPFAPQPMIDTLKGLIDER